MGSMIPKEMKYNLHYGDVWGDASHMMLCAYHTLQQGNLLLWAEIFQLLAICRCHLTKSIHLTLLSYASIKESYRQFKLIVLRFNDTSTLEGHFVSSPREREKRDRRESRGDEREGQGRKRNRNESEETEEIKTFPLYPYPLQG